MTSINSESDIETVHTENSTEPHQHWLFTTTEVTAVSVNGISTI